MIATLLANASEPWPLRDGVVHVWRFACAQPIDALAAVVSPEEHAIAARFASQVHRDAYVVQHALTRAITARYTGEAPRAIVFARGAHGKPSVARLELNLAHCDDVALLAIAHVAVGVDVERRDVALDLRALGRTVLAASEVTCGGDRDGFLRVWCRKEACLKATGVGLVDDLTQISVVDDAVEVEGATVYVRDLPLGDQHVAALATARPCAPIESRERELARFAP